MHRPFESNATHYRGKYRIRSARLAGRNYAGPGHYFVTICTDERIPWFGVIRDGRMSLSPVGTIADQYLRTIPDHFPFVRLDAFVVMPNHTHGIITIGWDRPDTVQPPGPRNPRHRMQWSPGCLGVIINQYKSVCTKHIRRAGFPDFAWQPGYYDRIIRDADAMETIRAYIRNNPAEW